MTASKKARKLKATVRHIKQVSGEPHAAQINLLHHKRMELPQHRHNKKKSHTKFNCSSSKPQCRNDLSHSQKIKGNHFQPSSNKLPPSGNHNQCSKCDDTAHREGFTCPTKKHQCRVCHKFSTSWANVSKRSNIITRCTDNPRHIKYR